MHFQCIVVEFCAGSAFQKVANVRRSYAYVKAATDPRPASTAAILDGDPVGLRSRDGKHRELAITPAKVAHG